MDSMQIRDSLLDPPREVPLATHQWLRAIATASRIQFGLWSLLLVWSAANVPPLAADENAKDDAFFQRVKPIFQAKCERCHGDRVRKAGLDLSRWSSLKKGGESGELIDLRSPQDSLLVEYIRSGQMPPPDEGKLTQGEVKAIVSWVESVAKHQPAAGADTISQHDVLPTLRLRCSVCHGLRRKEAGLDVRTKASLLKGGKSGPAIQLGRPESSLLLKRIHAGEMPPLRDLIKVAVKPMSSPEVATLTRWIAAGAPERQVRPSVMRADEPDPLVTDEERRFWAFQPPRSDPPPTVVANRNVLGSIDAFIESKLNAAGLHLGAEADRTTLIRRATIDLLGLPPTPQEIDSFVLDPAPDAYERLIDRLLASPRFGERWAQMWLDLAGYSDSDGIQHADRIRRSAYRYRDYVIQAMNGDKPYARFITEQLAGDELQPVGDSPLTREIYDNLVATGFLRQTPDATNTKLTGFVPDRLEIIDDEMEVFSSAVLGLTIKCARCHSHKFDPIPQRDYYRLAAVFKGALDEHDWLTPDERRLPNTMEQDAKAWREKGAKKEEQPQIRALWDRGEPSPTYVLRRGNYLTPGELVGPGVPSVLTDGRTPFVATPPWPEAKKTGRRLALAQWLTSNEHPLTARVIVNRVWKHHFGVGIVSTLDNFGTAGARPSHPRLLDWLAIQLVEDGWSLKRLHRRIMLSAAYRQSSQVSSNHERLDPDNRLLSRMPLKRMDGETLRDSLIFLAGELNESPFGPADAVDANPVGLVTTKRYQNGGWRRSIYSLKRRTQPVTLLQDFDVGRMDPNCIERTESIVAPQALHMKNNQWIRQLAERFGARVWRAGKTPDDRLRVAFKMAVGREPTAAETHASLRALNQLRRQWQSHSRGTRHQLIAESHLWIRETEPDRVFEDDLISVWSRAENDKGARWGLVQFDIRSLAHLDLTAARIELGAVDAKPIRQSAFGISPGIDQLSWNAYQATKAPSERAFQSLGRIVAAKGDVGAYQSCQGANADDLQRLRQLARTTGKLTLVFKADEDGAAYRRDWDDGVYKSTRNNPPRLVVHDSREDHHWAQQKAWQDFCHGLLNTAAFLYIE